jgi:hypothetical protein
MPASVQLSRVTAPADAPTPDTGGASAAVTDIAARQRWGALSRRSMQAGVSPSVWESLRQAGNYGVAETMIAALDTTPTAEVVSSRRTWYAWTRSARRPPGGGHGS